MTLQARSLVASKWLLDAVNGRCIGPKLRVLDTSWYLPKLRRNAKSEFKKRHIPDYVGNLGIGNDTHVVVYDASDFGMFSAPRVWWMFRVFGHISVSVLNGGLKNWVNEELPVSDRYTRPEQTEFRASLNRSWVKTYEDILDNLDSKEFQVVDARPEGRFLGMDPEPRDNTEPGHIPGSISMPFTSFLSPSGHLHSREELQDMFTRAGVDLSRPLCVSCGSGVTACHVALAAHECGHPGVSVYDGAWSEWYTRAVPEHVISSGFGKHSPVIG
ncbi:hypothetical protein UPYG_G00061730 [Umbra pygmaea]|uniref:Sulfurtransferase n=1 Tax=Umbra pygmaea TaxID=75934 RepID=A0ABD0X9J3_UMBPY